MKATIRSISLALAAAQSVTCIAGPTDPVGPSGWTTRNWVGLAIQIGLFLLALWAVTRLAGDE